VSQWLVLTPQTPTTLFLLQVVNSAGQAIALNAGTSTKSASSYYLPLNRPARALALFQKALRRSGGRHPGRATVPRGTLGTVMMHRAFGELRRLGLATETEAAVRRALPGETGMLVVEQVVPGGAAFGVVEPGDVVLTIREATEEEGAASDSADAAAATISAAAATAAASPAAASAASAAAAATAASTAAAASSAAAAAGELAKAAQAPRWASGGRGEKWCTTFLQLEALLDDRPGRWICLRVQRGGAELSFTLRVGDLHALSPTSVVEAGGCSFHELSYQQARNWNMPTGSVHVAFSGYMLSNANVPCRAVVSELNSIKTPTLDALTNVLVALPHGARVPIRYRLPYSQHQVGYSLSLYIYIYTYIYIYIYI